MSCLIDDQDTANLFAIHLLPVYVNYKINIALWVIFYMGEITSSFSMKNCEFTGSISVHKILQLVDIKHIPFSFRNFLFSYQFTIQKKEIIFRCCYGIPTLFD